VLELEDEGMNLEMTNRVSWTEGRGIQNEEVTNIWMTEE
jgi:hypothetical protein